MFGFRSDLPESGDNASKFIPWLVAIMVFLGTLAFSGVSVFDTMLSSWSRSVTGTLTIQIPALPVEEDGSANVERAEQVVNQLRSMSGVVSVRVLTGSELDALLAPWLGDDIGTGDLPLPSLIDVTLARDSEQNTSALREEVTRLVPNAVIDDHRRWFEHLIELTEGFRLLAIGVAAIVTAALALTVVYATRASLAEFREVIAVFHFIGARDLYVAGQFAKRTFLAASKGSIVGMVAGLVVLVSIGWLARNVESGFLPDITLSWMFWLSVPLIALLAALLAMMTAYATVLSTLRAMM